MFQGQSLLWVMWHHIPHKQSHLQRQGLRKGGGPQGVEDISWLQARSVSEPQHIRIASQVPSGGFPSAEFPSLGHSQKCMKNHALWGMGGLSCFVGRLIITTKQPCFSLQGFCIAFCYLTMASGFSADDRRQATLTFFSHWLREDIVPRAFWAICCYESIITLLIISVCF